MRDVEDAFMSDTSVPIYTTPGTRRKEPRAAVAGRQAGEGWMRSTAWGQRPQVPAGWRLSLDSCRCRPKDGRGRLLLPTVPSPVEVPMSFRKKAVMPDRARRSARPCDAAGVPERHAVNGNRIVPPFPEA